MACTSRLGRVIASSTRLTPQWRHFCTEASPSPPSSPTPSTAPSCSGPTDAFNTSASIGGELAQALAQADRDEQQLIEKLDKEHAKYFRKPRSPRATRQFLDKWYDKMKRNEIRNPGEVTKFLEGELKGLRLYKPTLEAVPSSLHWIKDRPEWQRIFMKNREMWHKEAHFDIVIEGDVFHLEYYIRQRCEYLTEHTVLGIPLRKKTPGCW